MARTRSITSINNEIKKVEEELIKVHNKQEELEARLLDLKNAKQERKGLLEKIPSLRDKLNTYEQLESSYEQVNFDMLKTYLDAPNKLVTVTKQLQKEIKELYADALRAMRKYSGHGDSNEDD